MNKHAIQLLALIVMFYFYELYSAKKTKTKHIYSITSIVFFILMSQDAVKTWISVNILFLSAQKTVAQGG